MFEDSKYRNLIDIAAIIIIVLFVVQVVNLKGKTSTSQHVNSSMFSSNETKFSNEQKVTSKDVFTIPERQNELKKHQPGLQNNFNSLEYTDYVKTLLSKKWKNINANDFNGTIAYMIEVYPDGKLKSFEKTGENGSNVKYDKTIERIINNVFPLKPLPTEWSNEQVVLNVVFGTNGNLQVSLYKKVKASEEQIKHQKQINAMRKSKGFQEFPVRDYIYVKDNYNAPIGTTLSGTQEKNVKNVNSIKQEKQITATSRVLTGNELELSNIRSSYVNYMAYSVRSNWKNPTGNNNYSLGLTFNIDKDGRITAYDILHSSESAAFDKAAIQCLLYTAPFKPIPAELQMDGLNAQIYFNGVEVQVGGISKLKPTYRLTYDVDQTNKTCKTIEINQAKRLRTQSMLPTSAPTDLHWEMGRQIQHSWNPPLNANSSVCLKFRVLRTGAVQNIQFEIKSYNDAADMAAYNSIKNLKLSQFPLTSKNMYIDVKYWFYVENNK